MRYGRGMDRVQDRDDWFAGLEPEENAARGEHAVDEWLPSDDLPARHARLPRIDRRILVLAAVGIALLIAALAAAGVFSSSNGAPTPTVASTQTTTPTTTSQAQIPPARPLAAPTAALKPGDTGAQVKVLQRALHSLGYSTGKIDGDYGPATQAAVERFQRSLRLTPDGIVGQQTLRALKSALRRR